MPLLHGLVNILKGDIMKRYAYIYRHFKTDQYNSASGYKYGTPELQVYEIETLNYTYPKTENYIGSRPVLTVIGQTSLKGIINEC